METDMGLDGCCIVGKNTVVLGSQFRTDTAFQDFTFHPQFTHGLRQHYQILNKLPYLLKRKTRGFP